MILLKTMLGVAALSVLISVGALSTARAQDFVIDKTKYEKHQAELNQPTAESRKAKKSRFNKGSYNGSSAYSGRSSSKAVIRRSDGSVTRRGMLPPIRASKGANTNLRYGDSSQSRETRLSHTLNN